MNEIPGLFNYWVVVFLMMAGFYVVISQGNLVKKLIGLGLFQTSVFILYITMGNLEGGQAPIIAEGVTAYSSPLPHVLILTAIALLTTVFSLFMSNVAATVLLVPLVMLMGDAAGLAPRGLARRRALRRPADVPGEDPQPRG